MSRPAHTSAVQRLAPKVLACVVALTGIFFTALQDVRAEQKQAMKSQISLPGEVAGWSWDKKEAQYDSKTLYQYINGAAELYLTYGFQNLRVRNFERAGQPGITLEVYEMASSEDAYGLFSFERQDEPVGIGQGSELGGGLLRFWKGKHFVSIYADGGGADAESAILTLGRLAAGLIPEAGSEPALVSSLPGKDLGLVDRTVRYLRSHVLLNQRFFLAHQNILHLGRRTEAVLAQYGRAQQKVTLLLVRYPNARDAGDAYQSFLKAYLPDAGAADRAKTEDGKWTVARQRGEFVVLVFGAPAMADAEALFKALDGKLLGER